MTTKACQRWANEKAGERGEWEPDLESTEIMGSGTQGNGRPVLSEVLDGIMHAELEVANAAYLRQALLESLWREARRARRTF